MIKGKTIILFLILILPIVIYLFLQGFGKNHFAIPIYYENGVSNSLSDCKTSTTETPYQLNLSEVSDLLNDQLKEDQIVVYELGNSDSEKLRNNLYTFLDKYKDREEVNLCTIRTIDDSSSFESRYNTWNRYYLADSNLMRFGRCILQLQMNKRMMADSGLVLVDKNQQIRGYYDPLELKEIDRLNTELYILLSEEPQKK